jgi:hypothetical protein
MTDKLTVRDFRSILAQAEHCRSLAGLARTHSMRQMLLDKASDYERQVQEAKLWTWTRD